jgi:CheY-like chemotaxis protein
MEKFSYKDAKILVVDDVEEVLNSTKNCLKLQGMQVECLSNPIEALEYLKNNRVDVLLLDFFMPEMNGDEFISELRKFDNETVVILRTGYSDKVPPLEIIDELNIQGYIDKIKGKDELILLTKSAIKTSFLNRTIKKQERMIEAEQYRNEFFGKFLYRFIGEVRERVFVIGGLIDSVTVDEQGLSLEEKKQYSQHIKEAIGKLMKIVESLEIEKISMLTVSTLEDILNSLFAISLEANKANLKFKYDNEYTSFQCDPKTLIYILVEIVEYLLNNNIKEINIDCEKQKEITIIKIGNMIKDEKVIAKIISISCIDNKIRIIKELNQVKIEVNS